MCKNMFLAGGVRSDMKGPWTITETACVTAWRRMLGVVLLSHVSLLPHRQRKRSREEGEVVTGHSNPYPLDADVSDTYYITLGLNCADSSPLCLLAHENAIGFLSPIDVEANIYLKANIQTFLFW
ncbi:unnamed protein product [Caretta caretta]